jgi:serine-type D-Ala-D-Ala carboxypeptidase (penicillin-binding protein 5/6)
MIIRRLVFGAAIAVTCALSISPLSAQQSGEFTTKAPMAILMDAETGSILFQKSADNLAPPASTSKLMTLAVMFRALRVGEIKLEDEFQTSEHAWRSGGAPSGTSAMFIPIHHKTSVDKLIQGIAVQSGNDACITVAEAMGGSEAGFAKMMEAEARRIGLTKSTFRNSTGLHDPEHLMTARDLAILARFLIREYPERYAVFAQRLFAYRRHKFYSRNPLLRGKIGVDGLKTGHTSKAGYNLVASAIQKQRRLIGVVLGLKSAKERRREARRLLEWGFRSFDEVTLFEEGKAVGYARVWGGTQMYVPLTGKGGPLKAILPRFPPNQKLRGQIVYQGPLKPPVKKGDEVGTFRVTSSSGATSEVPVYASEDVEEAGFMRKGLDSLLYLALRQVGL